MKWKWSYMMMCEKFRKFCSNLRMPSSVVSVVQARYHQITRRLNDDFYGWDSATCNSLYVGSYGRGTGIHISDIDIIFIMPYESYSRYNSHLYNGQSQLLQDLRASLLRTYPSTDISGDGQVTDVSFSDGMVFEVVPAIELEDNSFYYPDSNNGGSWRITNPRQEIAAIRELDSKLNGTLRHLCRMIRAWKDTCNVPMGGLQIDTFAARFLEQWKCRDKSFENYGLLTRDFFQWLSCVDDDVAYWYAIGSNQHVYNRGRFSYKALCAYNRALEALSSERAEHEWSANQKWRAIYGVKFPNY